jgi:hypothetical protein
MLVSRCVRLRRSAANVNEHGQIHPAGEAIARLAAELRELRSSGLPDYDRWLDRPIIGRASGLHPRNDSFR